MIDEEIYLHLWKWYTAQSIHLENIFKRLRNWARLCSSFFLVLVSTLLPLFAPSQLLWPCKNYVDQGFFHPGILRRVSGKNWVIHHLFKLRLCGLGVRPGIPVALVTVSPHCLTSLKRILHCLRIRAAFSHCTPVLSLYLAYDAWILLVFLLHSCLGSERNKFQDSGRITHS